MKKILISLILIICFASPLHADSKGILIAAHGMPGTWNEKLNNWAKPFKAATEHPLEVGFLEYTPSQTIEKAIVKLEEKEVNEIFLIQIMVSSSSSHTPEIYDAVLAATDKTPVSCIAAGFSDSVEMVSSIVERGKTACFIDDNIKGDKKEIEFKDASIIITFHGEPWGDVSEWHKLGVSLRDSVESKAIFKSVDYAINSRERREALKKVSGFPVFIPHFVVSGSYVDLLHPELLIKRNQGKVKYDGRCILDDKNGEKWLNRHLESIDSGEYEVLWTNDI